MELVYGCDALVLAGLLGCYHYYGESLGAVLRLEAVGVAVEPELIVHELVILQVRSVHAQARDHCSIVDISGCTEYVALMASIQCMCVSQKKRQYECMQVHTRMCARLGQLRAMYMYEVCGYPVYKPEAYYGIRYEQESRCRVAALLLQFHSSPSSPFYRYQCLNIASQNQHLDSGSCGATTDGRGEKRKKELKKAEKELERSWKGELEKRKKKKQRKKERICWAISPRQA